MTQEEINLTLDPRDQERKEAILELEDWVVAKVKEKSPLIDNVEALKVLVLSEIRQKLLDIEIELCELRQNYLMNTEFKNE